MGQYIATHATLLPEISSLLISTLPVHSPAFSPKPLPIYSALAAANTGSCVGPQNKIGHPADAGSRVECPRNINRLKSMTSGKMTLEMNNLEMSLTFVSSPDIVLCG